MVAFPMMRQEVATFFSIFHRDEKQMATTWQEKKEQHKLVMIQSRSLSPTIWTDKLNKLLCLRLLLCIHSFMGPYLMSVSLQCLPNVSKLGNIQKQVKNQWNDPN